MAFFSCVFVDKSDHTAPDRAAHEKTLTGRRAAASVDGSEQSRFVDSLVRSRSAYFSAPSTAFEKIQLGRPIPPAPS
jgi:hypothetical protein